MPWLEKNATLEDIRTAFAADKFATEQSGIVIDEASFGHAVCSMRITKQHLNAQGRPMGGAIFTLADFCLAVISNVGEEPTASVSSTIEYLAAARGDVLHATGRVLKSGRSLGFYDVDVTDDLGTRVAHFTATCHRRLPTESPAATSEQ